MPQQYNKPPLTFNDQLQKLIGRGLNVRDMPRALAQLESINYYRLSAYWYPFRQKAPDGRILDSFRPGADFDAVIDLYEFDRHLRLSIIDAIERIEVSVRTQVTYVLAHKYGAFAHANPRNFHPQFRHGDWLSKIEIETTRSNEEFIQHYQREYTGFPTIPIWMLTEVMSLGTLSQLYKGMLNDDKKLVSVKFNLHHKRMGDWLHTLTYVRNVCAHHGRLWNRELSIRPDQSKDAIWLAPITPTNTRIFYILLMLRHMLRAVSLGNGWSVNTANLIRPVAENPLWRHAMGMPDNWEGHPVWA